MPERGGLYLSAGVVKLANTLVLGASASACGFESHRPHQRRVAADKRALVYGCAFFAVLPAFEHYFFIVLSKKENDNLLHENCRSFFGSLRLSPFSLEMVEKWGRDKRKKAALLYQVLTFAKIEICAHSRRISLFINRIATSTPICRFAFGVFSLLGDGTYASLCSTPHQML